jgi:hypothetical protein
VVRDNIIADNPRGIETRGTGMVIEDNAICGSGSGGAILAVDGVSRFHHNTVVDSRGTALTFGGTSRWTVERNIIAFSTGFGLAGSGMADNRENLYFMNASGETDGITRSEPESDILDEDPRLADRSACDVRLGEGSPAAGRASDGSDIGVR